MVGTCPTGVQAEGWHGRGDPLLRAAQAGVQGQGGPGSPGGRVSGRPGPSLSPRPVSAQPRARALQNILQCVHWLVTPFVLTVGSLGFSLSKATFPGVPCVQGRGCVLGSPNTGWVLSWSGCDDSKGGWPAAPARIGECSGSRRPGGSTGPPVGRIWSFGEASPGTVGADSDGIGAPGRVEDVQEVRGAVRGGHLCTPAL